jgi:phospholipid/cholesterol/gamma-HCH transport system substrate-binding protein
VALPRDTIASIQTSGLLGDAYVSLSPGADSDTLAEGGMIRHTEPAISISELLARYAYGSFGGEQRQPPAQPPADSSSSVLDDL